MSIYIHQHLSAPSFNAILKDPKGHELAAGRAGINTEEGFIEFNSDFVPLYPLGSELEIYRLYGKREVHRFCGQVYLSDPSLIRLIKVTDEPLANASDVCCTDVSFPGTLSISIEAPKPTGFFRKKKKESISIPAVLTAMTEHQVEIFAEQEAPFPTDQVLSLTIPQPALFDETPVRVRKVFSYAGKTTYLCAIEFEPDAAHKRRMEFLNQHLMQHPRIFSL